MSEACALMAAAGAAEGSDEKGNTRLCLFESIIWYNLVFVLIDEQAAKGKEIVTAGGEDDEGKIVIVVSFNVKLILCE